MQAAAVHLLQVYVNGQPDGRQPSRKGAAKCDGCRTLGGPCNGWLCTVCDRCEWQCYCWDFDEDFSPDAGRMLPRDVPGPVPIVDDDEATVVYIG
jgi:hypothetical protein